MSGRVLACIVAFHPRLDSLSALIDRLRADADQVLVIDNGHTLDPHDARWAGHANVLWRQPGHNLGVAAALNVAVAHAEDHGFDWLHTFDQDSMPPAGLTGRLVEVARASGPGMAAFGPVLVDADTGRQFPSMLPMRWYRRKVMLAPQERVVVDHLITSGCLFAVPALRRVGLFNEDLFIDYVDVEWCLRARRAGLSVLQVGAERMAHSIGNGSIGVFGNRLAVHAPLRTYYQARNGAWLARQRALPLPWRLNDALRSLQKLVLLLLLGQHKAERLRQILRGLRDAATLKPIA